jgi:hypothetical protein
VKTNLTASREERCRTSTVPLVSLYPSVVGVFAPMHRDCWNRYFRLFLPFAWYKSSTGERILMNFYIGEFYGNLITHCIFCQNRTTLMNTLHEEQHDFLRSDMTGKFALWGIPANEISSRGIPCSFTNHEARFWRKRNVCCAVRTTPYLF